MRARNGLRKLIGCDRGNSMLVSAATLPLLISSAALAYDTVQLAIWTQQLEEAAAAGAAAGAKALAAGEPIEQAVARAIERDPRVHIVAPAVIAIAHAPGAGGREGRIVRVMLKSQRALPFLGALMQSPPSRTAGAEAFVTDAEASERAL